MESQSVYIMWQGPPTQASLEGPTNIFELIYLCFPKIVLKFLLTTFFTTTFLITIFFIQIHFDFKCFGHRMLLDLKSLKSQFLFEPRIFGNLKFFVKEFFGY